MILCFALLVACGDDDPAPTDTASSATPTLPWTAPTAHTGSTGTSTCDDSFLAGSTATIQPLSDHRYAWFDGQGRDDDLGYAVACSGTTWAAGAPENSEYADLPGGWAYTFDGRSTGQLVEDDASHILHGDPEESDNLGISLNMSDDGQWLWAGAWSSKRHIRFSGGVWGVHLPTAEEQVEGDSVDVYVVGAGHGAKAIRGMPLGDLDGDGIDELMVGNSDGSDVSEDGFLALYTGADLHDVVFVESATHTFDDRGAGNISGRSMWAADIDGDGHTDLVHGEPFDDFGPRVAIRLGPLLGGDADQDLAADVEIVAPTDNGGGVFGDRGDLGDVNGDGVVDLIFEDVSVPVDGLERAGSAYVFFGPLQRGTSLSADDAHLIIEGYASWGHFGSPVVADHDGDGTNDLIVAQVPWPSSTDCVGRLHVFRGPLEPGRRSALDADLIYENDRLGSGAGHAMAACDLDGDGDDEIVVGEPGYSGTEPNAGRVQVVEGWDFAR